MISQSKIEKHNILYIKKINLFLMSVIIKVNNNAYIFHERHIEKFKDLFRNENTLDIWFEDNIIIHCFVDQNGNLNVEPVDLNKVYQYIEEDASNFLKYELGVVKIKSKNVFSDSEDIERDLSSER